MKKAIVALSGGIDSAVAAAVAKEAGYELYFLTVDYGQNHLAKELENSKKLADFFGAKEHKIIKMEWIGQLGHSGTTVKDVDLHPENDDKIYVPYRNTNFIAACIAWAEINGAEAIYTGSEGGPWLCPDNSPEYYEKFNELLKVSTKYNKNLKIVAPLNYNSKTDDVRLGFKYHIPFEYTWTCVAKDDKACGICQPCRNRLKAFADLGEIDPIEYDLGVKRSLKK